MLFDGCGNLLGVPHLGILMSGSAWKLMFGAALARAFSSCDSHLSRLRVNERRRWGNLHLLKHNLAVRGKLCYVFRIVHPLPLKSLV